MMMDGSGRLELERTWSNFKKQEFQEEVRNRRKS
jgi:hypothetical protein